jgi:hypothetical protein
MGSFKKLKSSDVITVPVVANKQWDFNYCPLPINDPYISVYNGTYITGTFSPGEEPITNGQYDRLMYAMIDQMFYHKYTGSLSTASLASSLFYESASGLRPTNSYFNFNDDPGFINYFPTGVGESIKVVSISPDIYGERILPYSFQMTSSQYSFIDDGKGNVYDNGTHVGNIFYPEGIVVLTNQDYQGIFPLTPVANDDVITIIRSDYGNPVTLSISPLANDDLRGNILVNQSIQLFGGDISFFSTGSNNTISMSFSGLGTGVYQTYYTFEVTGSYCGTLTSNTGSIIITVLDPDCKFEMSIVQPELIILASPLVDGNQLVVEFTEV